MGWDKNKMEFLSGILDDIRNYTYEIDNCVRGCYTGCHTYKELANLFKDISERMNDSVSEFECEED